MKLIRQNPHHPGHRLEPGDDPPGGEPLPPARADEDVYVHYILSAGSVEEQMWELTNAKAAAQRAVFDKEALYKSVEQVMAEAVSAQIQVAQAVLAVERAPLLGPELKVESAPEHREPSPQQSVHQLTMADLFQRHGALPAGRQERNNQPVVRQQLSLFGSQPAASAA